MKEKNLIILLSIIFIITGSIGSYIAVFYTDFNFSKSELTINGLEITEKLTYNTDKAYHTLYRNFNDEFYSQARLNLFSYIEGTSVSCSAGKPYVRDADDSCFTFPGAILFNCPAYTEYNEYGCTFGNSYGFEKNKEYWIQSTYILHPQSIFLIKNNYYVKFIAYSPNKHVYLTENNFIVYNVVKQSNYLPSSNVIVYIPFLGDTSQYNIIKQDDFEFDSSLNLLIILIFFLPALVIFLLWFFFGRETSDADIPKELSNYPNERPGYEVAAFFNPPFNANENFFSAMVLSFYQKKIIDLKTVGTQTYMKILNFKKLTPIETEVMDLLVAAKDLAIKKSLVENGFFDISKVFSKYGYKFQAYKMSLDKELKKAQKEYMSLHGFYAALICQIIFFFSAGLFAGILNLSSTATIVFILQIAFFAIVVNIMNFTTALFTSYKEKYHVEYLHWQSFKNYLKNSYAMRSSTHEGLVLWEKYLIYASALGVSKKLLKRLKALHLIDTRTYNTYYGVYSFSHTSFGSSGGATGGGAGGGGVGGGGGGGR